MGTTRIPQKYIHVCDGCNETVESKTNVWPKGWGLSQLKCPDYREDGSFVRNVELTHFLCRECLRRAKVAIYALVIRRELTEDELVEEEA